MMTSRELEWEKYTVRHAEGRDKDRRPQCLKRDPIPSPACRKNERTFREKQQAITALPTRVRLHSLTVLRSRGVRLRERPRRAALTPPWCVRDCTA
ncbi:hypothetical protein NDU88_003690 [Pleurodeles waltl]|uniref:Uncharacterized protein n=1 Tax=Pleurodeles waltl TaxID=8319 RepID=A0AAV7TP24_PLEWA|nr:hypothetical protein NDU88_003690 [Pleurodeles waltl]